MEGDHDEYLVEFMAEFVGEGGRNFPETMPDDKMDDLKLISVSLRYTIFHEWEDPFVIQASEFRKLRMALALCGVYLVKKPIYGRTWRPEPRVNKTLRKIFWTATSIMVGAWTYVLLKLLF